METDVQEGSEDREEETKVTNLDGVFFRSVTVYPSIEWSKSGGSMVFDTEIEADVELLTDSNYGADADGKRGQTRTWINLVTLRSMQIRINGRHWMNVAINQEQIRGFLTEQEFDYIIDCVCDEVLEKL